MRPSVSSSGLTRAKVASLLGAASRVQRPPREVAEAIAGRDGAALAIVQEAHPSVALIHEIVGSVPDEDDSRPLGHVGVIGHVDEQLRQDSLFDPAVKYGDEFVEGDALR
jgi:hypothetical protein